MAAERTLLQERLIGIVRHFSQRKILVVGDSIADQFVFGAISRVSREAPVFILRHEHTETVPGGAANCAVNLASLGAQVSLVSTAGEDEAGKLIYTFFCGGKFSSIAADAFGTYGECSVTASAFTTGSGRL